MVACFGAFTDPVWTKTRTRLPMRELRKTNLAVMAGSDSAHNNKGRKRGASKGLHVERGFGRADTSGLLISRGGGGPD